MLRKFVLEADLGFDEKGVIQTRAFIASSRLVLIHIVRIA